MEAAMPAEERQTHRNLQAGFLQEIEVFFIFLLACLEDFLGFHSLVAWILASKGLEMKELDVGNFYILFIFGWKKYENHRSMKIFTQAYFMDRAKAAGVKEQKEDEEEQPRVELFHPLLLFTYVYLK